MARLGRGCGTGRLVWLLTPDTEPGSAADLAPAYEVHFPFQASALPPLTREFNKASLEAGVGDRLDPAHQSWGFWDGWVRGRSVFSLRLFLWRASLCKMEIGVPSKCLCGDEYELPVRVPHYIRSPWLLSTLTLCVLAGVPSFPFPPLPSPSLLPLHLPFLSHSVLTGTY